MSFFIITAMSYLFTSESVSEGHPDTDSDVNKYDIAVIIKKLI